MGSGDVRIEINRGWRGWLRNQVTGYLRRLGREVLADARRLAPARTGRLRASLYMEVQGSRVIVGTRNVDYALDVEYGTRPHVIRPRIKKALHWPGARHPVKQVNHPGTPAQPYLRPALYRRRG